MIFTFLAEHAWISALVGVVVAAVDGPFLGGIAAILTSIFTFILGLLALHKSNQRSEDRLRHLERQLDDRQRERER